MGQFKKDVIRSLEFLEHQMRGEEAWEAVYAEVSPIGTRMEQRGRASELPEKGVDMEPATLLREGRGRSRNQEIFTGELRRRNFIRIVHRVRHLLGFSTSTTIGRMLLLAAPRLVLIDRKLPPKKRRIKDPDCIS